MSETRVKLIPAPPNTFALLVRPIHPDSTVQQWELETVVAFDSADGGAYVVGGFNRSGQLERLYELAASNEFTLVGVWEQCNGGREAAEQWVKRHVEMLYKDAAPLERDDPRRDKGGE